MPFTSQNEKFKNKIFYTDEEQSYNKDYLNSFINEQLEKPLKANDEGNFDKRDIDKIAAAWNNFDCAIAILATINHNGGGYYLSCGNINNCKVSDDRYHVHLYDTGIVTLKENNEHVIESNLIKIILELNWYDENKENPSAYQMSSLIYIWAGYNQTEDCAYLNFN